MAFVCEYNIVKQVDLLQTFRKRIKLVRNGVLIFSVEMKEIEIGNSEVLEMEDCARVDG